jgi:L-threonylcarbamoyladenylate synthase
MGAPRASGTLEAHYAPSTPVALIEAENLSDVLSRLDSAGRRAAVIRRTLPQFVNVVAQFETAADPAGYAHDLYAALRAMDTFDADVILVEAPPASAPWHGVNDRLRRAAHDSAGIISRLLTGGPGEP